MSELTFVNIHGERVSTVAPPAPPKPREGLTRTRDADKATHLFGYEVTGLPLEALEIAKDEAKRKDKEFDENAWLAKARRKRALPRVFNLSEAAQQAADILTRSGTWLHVRAEPIYKAPK